MPDRLHRVATARLRRGPAQLELLPGGLVEVESPHVIEVDRYGGHLRPAKDEHGFPDDFGGMTAPFLGPGPRDGGTLPLHGAQVEHEHVVVVALVLQVAVAVVPAEDDQVGAHDTARELLHGPGGLVADDGRGDGLGAPRVVGDVEGAVVSQVVVPVHACVVQQFAPVLRVGVVGPLLSVQADDAQLVGGGVQLVQGVGEFAALDAPVDVEVLPNVAERVPVNLGGPGEGLFEPLDGGEADGPGERGLDVDDVVKAPEAVFPVVQLLVVEVGRPNFELELVGVAGLEGYFSKALIFFVKAVVPTHHGQGTGPIVPGAQDVQVVVYDVAEDPALPVLARLQH